MDPARVALLFGPDAEALDGFDQLDDPDVRSMLLDDELGDDFTRFDLAVLTAIANQIIDDDPPHVWETAQRLLASGRDRLTVLRDLVSAFAPIIRQVVAGEDQTDPAIYVAALDALPFPTADEIEAVLIDLVRATPNIDADALFRQAAQLLGRDIETPAVEAAIDRVFDEIVTDPFGPLDFGYDNGVAHVPTITAGMVLTHRLTAEERQSDTLDLSFDLAGFLRRSDLHAADGGAVRLRATTSGSYVWAGPPAWLDAFEPGTLLAVRIGDDGEVTLDPVEEPAADGALVALVRASYDDIVAEPWLSVGGEELLIGVALRQPDAFAEPRLPLTDLAAAAGLEQRGHEVAHERSVWDNGMRAARQFRILRAFDDDLAGANAVLGVLDVADLVFGVDPELVARRPVDTPMLRTALADLADLDLFDAVVAELLEDAVISDPDARPRAEAFVEALLAAAATPVERATAHLLASRQAELGLDLAGAERHLTLAHAADGSNGMIIDRLAWYASDRGDAPRAGQLWGLLERTPAVELDLRVVEAAASTTAGAAEKIGRNDPCWCGSGRKSKQCHQGAPPLPALPERFPWLGRKVLAYLDRGPVAARRELIDLTMELADDPDDLGSLHEALANPIARDLLLHEGGWLRRFVDDRSALLPEDERALVESWLDVDRAIYEVTAVRVDDGLDLRLVGGAEPMKVRDPLATHEARVGDLLCTRPLPDGESHQLFGGTFLVAPEDRDELQEILADGDPLEIAAWVRDAHAPDDPFDHPTIRQAIDERLDLDRFEEEGGYQQAFLDTPEGIAMLGDIRDKYEQRWCDTVHPALGRTPREAADHAEQHDDLRRAIDALAPDTDDDNPVALRPERLLALLGLAED